MTTVGPSLRETLARRTGTRAEDWHLVFRARHGMLVVLRELKALRGEGSVVTQLLTCCTAVDPIVTAGLRPVYADVDAQTMAVDPQTLPDVADLRAIVCQHTFGYIDQAQTAELRRRAHEAGALLLEDCAHCVGRLATDDGATPLADVSFHSFGVEKMLPTYFGGAVYLNPNMADGELRQRIEDALRALPEPTGCLSRAMRSYRTQIRVLNHLPRPLARGLRATLTNLRLFEPAISELEMAGGVAHEPLAAGAWAQQAVAGPLAELPASEELRVRALQAYARELAGIEGVRTSEAMLGSGQPLLRLPLNVCDDATADRVIAAIGAQGLYAVPWYRPLLYPGVTDDAAYGYDRSLAGLSRTAELARGAVALPCDLTDEQVAAVVRAIRSVVAEG